MYFAVDTNILVYRYDIYTPRKRAIARRLLRDGLVSGKALVPYQALIEFVSVMTRTRGQPLVASRLAALQEAQILVSEFPILYPTAGQLELALAGCALHGMSWFDACMWSYAEHHGIPVLYSEDLQHGRVYGGVTVVNPFREVEPDGVAER